MQYLNFYMDNSSVENASIFFISHLKELFKKSLSLLRLLQRYYLHGQLSSFKNDKWKNNNSFNVKTLYIFHPLTL